MRCVKRSGIFGITATSGKKHWARPSTQTAIFSETRQQRRNEIDEDEG